MTKYGLRTRVYLLTILPTLVIGILLASYFSINRSQQLETFVIDQGLNVIEPLAIAGEIGMAKENREKIKHLISSAHQKNSLFIKSIAVFDANNELFVTSNFHRDFEQLKLTSDIAQLKVTKVEFLDQYIILRSPIFSEKISPESGGDSLVIGYIALQYNKDRSVLLIYRDTSIAIGIVLIGLLIAGGISLRLMKGVTKPVSDMVTVVDKIGRGQLNIRVEGQYTGELEQLSTGINSMAMSMSTYQEEMQQSIDQATSDLRETLEQIEIQNVELDIAKKSAQEAARVKSEFLANMSHELRTPLNGVIGFARQLQKTSLSRTQTDHIHTIEKSANNLLTIINDILDFSKLEAGKLILEKITFSVRETVEEVMNLLAPSANEKNLELSLLINSEVPDDVIGDPFRFQQVITNLASNAIKFTEKGDIHIHIWLEAQDGSDVIIKVAVKDTGLGISEDHQARLFQSFNQADTSITRRYGGTGLGLVITQKLVQHMDGEILLNSTPGEGSTFLFSIRLEMSYSSVAPKANIEQLMNQRILLLEQNENSRHSLKKAMEPWPIELTACRDPRQWQRELSNNYDWILLGHDPSEPLSSLVSRVEMANEANAGLIVMIASNDPLVGDQLLTKGATSYLNKPVNLHKLAQALGTHSDEEELSKIQLAPATNTEGYTVMAVDDNMANLKLISAILGEMVGNVKSYKNGKEAVDAAQKHKFDLIFMDIQMPILDGISACQQIRTIELNKNTPIIAVTAHAMEGEKDKLLQVGMDDYLAKPLDENSLEQAIETWITNGKPRDQSKSPQQVKNKIENKVAKPTPKATPKTRISTETRAQLAKNKEKPPTTTNTPVSTPVAVNTPTISTPIVANKASSTPNRTNRFGTESRAPLAKQLESKDTKVKPKKQVNVKAVEKTPAPQKKPKLKNDVSDPAIIPKSDANVLDWSLALQRAHNKEDLAKEMLEMLIKSFDDVLNAQSAALDREISEEALTKVIHKFHGGCSYCGCPNLKNLAATLEQQLKKGASIDDIEPELFELEDEIDKVLVASKKYL